MIKRTKRIKHIKKHKWFKLNILVLSICLILLTKMIIGYIILSDNSQYQITNNDPIRVNQVVRAVENSKITDIHLNPNKTTCGYSKFNPHHVDDNFVVNLSLPALDCTIAYTITLKNRSDNSIIITDINKINYNNESIIYELIDFEIGDMLQPNAELKFQIVFKYNPNLTALPNNPELGAIIKLIWHNQI